MYPLLPVGRPFLSDSLAALLRAALAGRVALPAADSRPRHAFAGREQEAADRAEALALAAWSAAAGVRRGLQLASRLLARGRAVPDAVVDETVAEAKEGGASAVGLAEVTPDLVFAGRHVPAPHALVLLVPMEEKAVRTAPSPECLRAVDETYARLGALAERLADRLRGKGYAAFPSDALGGAVDYPSLAARAGLGVRGASGLLVSEGSGPCQRIGAVFLELEQAPTPRDAGLGWVPSYCAKCQRCVRACPAQAIRADPPASADGHVACADGDRCLAQFQRSWGCGVCIKVCPLVRGDLASVRRAFEKKPKRRR